MLKKLLVLILLITTYALLVTNCPAQSESITFTTYYPSPYGVYRRLRVQPSAADPGEGPASACTNPGELYFDSTANNLYICSGSPSTWVAVGGGAGGYWDVSPSNPNNIYNTNSGNVGIGTTGPGTTLDVAGTIRAKGFGGELISYGGGEPRLTLDDTEAGGRKWGVLTNTNWANGGLSFFDHTIGTSRMIIDNLGNVGIGTAAPADKLHVHNSASQGIISISGISDGGATYSALYLHDGTADNNNNWVIAHKKRTGTVEEDDLHIARWISPLATRVDMVIDSGTGNVGIGTSSPSVGLKLGVAGKVGATAYCDENGLNCKTVASITTLPTCAEGSTLKFSGGSWVCSGASCIPCACAASTCSGSTCVDGCGTTCAGTKSCCTPSCACAASICTGSTCTNGCGGTCPGTKSPSCSCAADTCVGSTCSNGCGGLCVGTKSCKSCVYPSGGGIPGTILDLFCPSGYAMESWPSSCNAPCPTCSGTGGCCCRYSSGIHIVGWGPFTIECCH